MNLYAAQFKNTNHILSLFLLFILIKLHLLHQAPAMDNIENALNTQATLKVNQTTSNKNHL